MEVFFDVCFFNFKGIMVVKKKLFEVILFVDFGVLVDLVVVLWIIMMVVLEKFLWVVGVKIIDEGDVVDKFVEYFV